MKYLGVDFGLKRIGLSISEGDLASTWKVIEVSSLKDATEQIEKIMRDDNFDKVIVGLPEGKMGGKVKRFNKLLRGKNLVVEEADETLSTQQATANMIELNIPVKKRRINDDMAAAIILQSWLDNNSA